MELSTEEIAQLNKILLNIGFEGEGGVAKASNSYLLGDFQVTEITQTPESTDTSTEQASHTTLFKQNVQDFVLHSILEPVGEFFQATVQAPIQNTVQAPIQAPDKETKPLQMKSHYTDKELIKLLTRVGES